MFYIRPYRENAGWVFDDPARNLYREPLIAGTAELCNLHAAGRDSFGFWFDEYPFDNAYPLIREAYDPVSKESWYRHEGNNILAYFCPELFRYFRTIPEIIYYRVD